jgi:hypothetical protein
VLKYFKGSQEIISVILRMLEPSGIVIGSIKIVPREIEASVSHKANKYAVARSVIQECFGLWVKQIEDCGRNPLIGNVSRNSSCVQFAYR